MNRRVRAVLACAALSSLLLVAPGAQVRAEAMPSNIPQSHTTAPTKTVGALFAPNSGGQHTCTATVLASPTQDLVITAAHCLAGTGAGWTFVPAYDKGKAPYGVWHVTAAYVRPLWQSKQSPLADIAILRLAKQTRGGHSVGIQQVTGGVRLATAAAPGTVTTVTAYNGGSGDRPITCTQRVLRQSGYPMFECGGYVGGSSGSAFVTGSGQSARITGVIGGLHQGGCVDYVSYSSPFRLGVMFLFARAELHRTGDNVVQPGDDGC
ncbi:trypsin-like serine peptidase [Branchiibius hedensis]|uniref:trypsin-like serine peptidase n=1 Tax=Branchiibius hedensis TaxID=672460 RepID=UPI000D6C510C|nr:trypsin-like serine protease [Branchiibius hedensis]